MKLQDVSFKKLKLATLFLVISQISYTQAVSSIGFEAGITFSQFPRWHFEDMANTKITDLPLPGPLIGISKKWILSKHFLLTSGLQYQLAGSRYNMFEKAINYSYSENLTINKICIPLNLGLVFNIEKFRPSLFLGIRPDILLSAKRSAFSVSYKSVTNLYKEPLGVSGYKPPKRLLCQLSTGFSFQAGHHLQINVSFNYGNNYYLISTTHYSVATSIPNGTFISYSVTDKTSIASSDYIISIVYFFNRSESKNSKSS